MIIFCKFQRSLILLYLNILRGMQISKYPVNFGDPSKLNARGERFAPIVFDSGLVRIELVQDSISSELSFRDKFKENFVSLFTNTTSLSYPTQWFNLRSEPGFETKLENLRDTSTIDKLICHSSVYRRELVAGVICCLRVTCIVKHIYINIVQV